MIAITHNVAKVDYRNQCVRLCKVGWAQKFNAIKSSTLVAVLFTCCMLFIVSTQHLQYVGSSIKRQTIEDPVQINMPLKYCLYYLRISRHF